MSIIVPAMMRLEQTGAVEEIHLEHQLRSVIACLIGTFLLRGAAGVMGNMIHLYLADVAQLAEVGKFAILLPLTVRSAISAVFFIPELFFAPVLGAWSDRYGRKLFIMLGPLMGAIAVQLTALVPAAWGVWFLVVIALTRFLEGLSTASAVPATLSYLSAVTTRDAKFRGRVMGMFEIATFGGIIFGIFIGGRMYDSLKHNAFHWNSVIYLLSLAVFYFGLLEVRNKVKRTGPFSVSAEMGVARKAFANAFAGIRVAFRSDILVFAPAWWAINSLPGLWMNNIAGVMRSSEPRFYDQLFYGVMRSTPHFGRQISDVAVVVLGLFTVGVLGWSLIVGRFRRTRLMLICSLGLFVIVAALFLANHTGTCGYGPLPRSLTDCSKQVRLLDPILPVYLGAAALALMVVSGFTPAALTYLADITEKSPVNRGAIMGLYTVLFGFGQLSGEFLGGPFGDWLGFDGLVLFTFLLSLLAVGTILLLIANESKSAVPAPVKQTIT